jgi:coenzyme F420-reducing hydrogenase delta subunit/Fe-S-cluster-containing hydrogenase component 2
MCSGRVDPEFIFRALSNGMDGVFIGGCLLNECNYTTHGNYQALNMTLLCKKLLEHIGLNPDRLRIEFMSSGEGMAFVDAVNDFVRQVKVLGPVGKAEGITGDELATKLAEVRKLIPYIKMTKREKLEARLLNKEDYAGYYTSDEIEALFSEIVSYYIDPEKCQACMLCAKNCPVNAIESAKKQIHVIDQEKCIKCETCYKVCPDKFSAVTKIVSAPVPEPVPVEARAIARGES